MTVLPFPEVRMVDNQAAPACAASTGRKPHPATDGLLCRWHFEELGRWLHDIEDEAARLVFDAEHPDWWAVAPRMETSYEAGTSSSLASQRAPAVLDAIAYTDDRSTAHGRRHIGPVCAVCPERTGLPCICPPGPTRRRDVHWAACPRVILHPSCLHILADRDEGGRPGAQAGRTVHGDPEGDALLPVLAVLHEWAQRVRDERKLEPPTGDVIVPLRGPGGVLGEWRRAVPVAPTVMSERLVLTRQLGWIAGQPWVADMRRELGDLRRQLMELNRNQDPTPLPGWCFRYVDDGRGGKAECGGDLWPAEPLHTTGYETRSGMRAVECAKNPKHHRWEGDDLPRLLAAIEQQRREDDAS